MRERLLALAAASLLAPALGGPRPRSAPPAAAIAPSSA